MKPTFTKRYLNNNSGGVPKSHKIGLSIPNTSSQIDLSPEQIYNKKQLDRIHNAIHFTKHHFPNNSEQLSKIEVSPREVLKMKDKLLSPLSKDKNW